jgi:hypothetical protein
LPPFHAALSVSQYETTAIIAELQRDVKSFLHLFPEKGKNIVITVDIPSRNVIIKMYHFTKQDFAS